ncbi:hypothetical protein T11_7068 [Trichinella zimbabwensis]|uniref:Uncharacterized protein n=1 Tax=Trichinella zimbabwensis TaxID=268475 RepID=A0A0V1HVH3_9BILA|nr:hypothetical protein T11_7068 [Trichinella zimbabwensis]
MYKEKRERKKKIAAAAAAAAARCLVDSGVANNVISSVNSTSQTSRLQFKQLKRRNEFKFFCFSKRPLISKWSVDGAVAVQLKPFDKTYSELTNRSESRNKQRALNCATAIRPIPFQRGNSVPD